MDDFKKFTFADGHIESISIEKDNVKVSFRRWDEKQFTFVFTESCYQLSNCSYQEIGGVVIEPLKKGISKELDYAFVAYREHEIPSIIRFFEAWEDKCVFTIVARAVDIVECGDCL